MIVGKYLAVENIVELCWAFARGLIAEEEVPHYFDLLHVSICAIEPISRLNVGDFACAV